MLSYLEVLHEVKFVPIQVGYCDYLQSRALPLYQSSTTEVGHLTPSLPLPDDWTYLVQLLRFAPPLPTLVLQVLQAIDTNSSPALV